MEGIRLYNHLDLELDDDNNVLLAANFQGPIHHVDGQVEYAMSLPDGAQNANGVIMVSRALSFYINVGVMVMRFHFSVDTSDGGRKFTVVSVFIADTEVSICSPLPY